MSDQGPWIVIPNWAKFQHRADRALPWLKLYTELSGRDDWRQLSLAQRGLLVCLWIEYRRSKGQLRTSDIPSRVAQKVPRRSLNSLVAAGFIELSATQPPQLEGALDKRRIDKTPPTPPQGGPVENLSRANPGKELALAWIRNGVAAEIPADRLPAVLADEFGITDPGLVADLVKTAQEKGAPHGI